MNNTEIALFSYRNCQAGHYLLLSTYLLQNKFVITLVIRWILVCLRILNRKQLSARAVENWEIFWGSTYFQGRLSSLSDIFSRLACSEIFHSNVVIRVDDLKYIYHFFFVMQFNFLQFILQSNLFSNHTVSQTTLSQYEARWERKASLQCDRCIRHMSLLTSNSYRSSRRFSKCSN